MKIRRFLFWGILSCLSVTGGLAKTYTVTDAVSFQAAWGQLQSGDTLILTKDLDLGAMPSLSPLIGAVSLQSEEGKNYSLTWGEGNINNAPLPGMVTLNNVTVTGAPATFLMGDTIAVGSGTQWLNNTGSLLKANLSLVIGKNNTFKDNVAADGGNGAVIAAKSGSSVEIDSGNVFSNNRTTGRGGAIYVESRAESLKAGYVLTLRAEKSGSSIVFQGNTEETVWENGEIKDPGYANDIYLGAHTKALFNAGEGARIVLGSGLASADETASITKTGQGNLAIADAAFYGGDLALKEGSVTLSAGNIWGTREASLKPGTVTVEKGATFILQKSATLASDLNLNGGSLTVVAPAALEGNLTLGDGMPEIRFILNQGLLNDAGKAPLLSLSSHFTVTGNTEDSVLMTNLDVSGMSSLANATTLQPYGDWSVLKEDTREKLSSGLITYTDAKGTHLLPENMLDPMTGTLDISKLNGIINFDRPGAAVANSLWSSTRMLSIMWNAVGNQLSERAEGAPGKSVWFSGLAGMSRVDSEEDRNGYDFSGGGYALGVDFKSSAKVTLGIALSQFFGKNDAKGDLYSDANASIDQNALMAGIYGQFRPSESSTRFWTINAFLGYGATDNDMKTDTGKGSWNDTNFAASVEASLTYVMEDRIFLRPFLGLDFLNGSQDGFSTGGKNPLHYEGADMYTLSLPIGITLGRSIDAGPGTLTPSLTLAYVADVARDCPSTEVSDANGTSWTARSIEPGRSALRVKASLDRQWSPAWSGSLAYILNTRSQETTHTFTAGLRYSF